MSAFNKATAHNSFAVPVLTPTFGILDWTIDELETIDKKTRKLLTVTGNFVLTGDIDRLYLPRSDGGRGLKSIFAAYKARLVSLHQHLMLASSANDYISKVLEHEQNMICRIAAEIRAEARLNVDMTMSPRAIGKSVTKTINNERKISFESKVMHGYVARQLKATAGVDTDRSLSWPKDRYLSSHFEGYANAILEQEIYTKSLFSKRKSCLHQIDNKCRLCKRKIEDVSHVIAGCEKMATRYYLPLRHDVVAKTLWNELHIMDSGTRKVDQNLDVDSEGHISVQGDKEFWWNVPIKTCSKVKHNRPDIVMWNHCKKECTIIEVACPLDVNIVAKETEKTNIYGPLIRNLQLMYHGYAFSFVPIIIGATGYVTKNLSDSLKELGFATNQELDNLIRKLQVLTISGTVKIAKTFLKFMV